MTDNRKLDKLLHETTEILEELKSIQISLRTCAIVQEILALKKEKVNCSVGNKREVT